MVGDIPCSRFPADWQEDLLSCCLQSADIFHNQTVTLTVQHPRRLIPSIFHLSEPHPFPLLQAAGILCDKEPDNLQYVFSLLPHSSSHTPQAELLLLSDCRQSCSGIYIPEQFFFYETNFV